MISAKSTAEEVSEGGKRGCRPRSAESSEPGPGRPYRHPRSRARCCALAATAAPCPPTCRAPAARRQTTRSWQAAPAGRARAPQPRPGRPPVLAPARAAPAGSAGPARTCLPASLPARPPARQARKNHARSLPCSPAAHHYLACPRRGALRVRRVASRTPSERPAPGLCAAAYSRAQEASSARGCLCNAAAAAPCLLQGRSRSRSRSEIVKLQFVKTKRLLD